jgi:hypothetical protein
MLVVAGTGTYAWWQCCVSVAGSAIGHERIFLGSTYIGPWGSPLTVCDSKFPLFMPGAAASFSTVFLGPEARPQT